MFNDQNNEEYEYCPRCDANLTLQKGYSNTLPYWVCKGCGEMLINPEVEGDIAWICDGCGEMLNIQLHSSHIWSDAVSGGDSLFAACRLTEVVLFLQQCL